MTPACEGWFILGILLGMCLVPIAVGSYRLGLKLFVIHLEAKEKAQAIKDMEDYVNKEE